VTLNIYCNWQNTFVENSTKLPLGKRVGEDISLGETQKGGEMAIRCITLSCLFCEDRLG